MTLVSKPWKERGICMELNFGVRNTNSASINIFSMLRTDRKETATEEHEQEHREGSLQVQQWERRKDVRLTTEWYR